MHSISDLTTTCQRATGHVPPRLVGASTTVVGSKMYLFGGRLVAERTMVSEMHIFDLKTYSWEEPIKPHPDDAPPPARYFHSADPWGKIIIVFGGMGNNPDSPDPEDLIVLHDVWLYDITTNRWSPGVPPVGPGERLPPVPRARYAHLSAVTANTLYIIGGQDINNVWLDDVCGFDLQKRAWVLRRAYPRHCGTYRSVAVAPILSVVSPETKPAEPSSLGTPGTRFQSDGTTAKPVNGAFTETERLIHQPYSTEPPPEQPSDIFLYSNYNFTDVKRELEVFSPLPIGVDSDFTISDRSSTMTGSSLPPGLRFPTGAVLGHYLILTGTYLAHTFQTYSVWALDLTTNAWHRIEPGAPLLAGSWFRSALYAEGNKLLVFGDRHGSLVEDYNRRLLCWEDVATIDLEAFGFYQPPPRALSVNSQELGLAMLEEGTLADFELVCDDSRRIRVSRRILEERWPWFAKQRRKFVADAARTTGDGGGASIPLPSTVTPIGAADDDRCDPRLTPRAFYLTEPYPIVLAFAQYFYTRALVTPLQHAPAVLSQLLVLSSLYELQELQNLCVHAMHRALSKSTSVGVYEVATLTSCRSLQIRALKTVMAYNSKKTTGRSRKTRGRENGDSDGGGGGGGFPDADGGSAPGGYGGGGGAGGYSNGNSGAARARGMSDASFMKPSTSNGSNVQGYGYHMANAEPPMASSSYAPLVVRKNKPSISSIAEDSRETVAETSQIQELLFAARLEDSRRRVGLTPRALDPQLRQSIAEDDKPLPSLPPPSPNVGGTTPTARRRPNFLPLDDPSPSGPRPRPTLDTTDQGLGFAHMAISPDLSDLPTPVLSAAFGASPLSASSSGPVTPSTGGLPGTSGRTIRTPSLLSMSPTGNPFQVIVPPPVPPMPAAAAVSPTAKPKSAPLRAWTSLGNLEDDGSSKNTHVRVEDDILKRSQSQGDDLSTLVDMNTKRAESKHGQRSRTRGESLSRVLFGARSPPVQAPPKTVPEADNWDGWESKDSWARVAR